MSTSATIDEGSGAGWARLAAAVVAAALAGGVTWVRLMQLTFLLIGDATSGHLCSADQPRTVKSLCPCRCKVLLGGATA